MKSITAIGVLALLPFLTLFTLLYFGTHRIKWLASRNSFEPQQSLKNACIQ